MQAHITALTEDSLPDYRACPNYLYRACSNYLFPSLILIFPLPFLVVTLLPFFPFFVFFFFYVYFCLQPPYESPPPPPPCLVQQTQHQHCMRHDQCAGRSVCPRLCHAGGCKAGDELG